MSPRYNEFTTSPGESERNTNQNNNVVVVAFF